jgi:hypothetical protein
VKDQAVGQRVVVLDDLALLGAIVLSDDAATTESQPLDEVIERLALVGRRQDRGCAEVYAAPTAPYARQRT